MFHLTHAKAGSQWVYRILLECAPDRVIPPRLDMAQVLEQPIRPGAIYPVLFLPREEFDEIRLPPGSRLLVVIRDLRDTLVSLYYSVKFSHPPIPIIAEGRARMSPMDLEEGLLFAMDEWLLSIGHIQESWLASGEPLIRFEDLLEHDLEILERVLLDEWGLPVARERLREVVLASRFEQLTGGRRRGCEDRMAHERKGVAGDWRTHFTDRVKTEFKARFGDLLVATGYEQDLAW